jgi:hypothetical protein
MIKWECGYMYGKKTTGQLIFIKEADLLLSEAMTSKFLKRIPIQII